MINGEYFAGRTIEHLVPTIDTRLGIKQCQGRFSRVSSNSLNLDGIVFDFNVSGGELDIVIEKKDIPNFDNKVKDINDKVFWKNSSLTYLKKQKNKYGGFLDDINISLNGSGNYHIKTNLKTKNEDKAFFAVLNCIVKPLIYSFGS